MPRRGSSKSSQPTPTTVYVVAMGVISGKVPSCVAAAAILAVSGASCGGSDDADDAEAASSAAVDETADDTDTDSDSDEAPGSAEDADDGGDEFCDRIRDLDETGDTDDDLGAAAEEFGALVNAAPDELRDDLQTVSEAFSEVADLDQDDPESFAELFEVFGRPDVIAAAENLERYGVEECGLEPPSSSDVDVAGDGST